MADDEMVRNPWIIDTPILIRPEKVEGLVKIQPEVIDISADDEDLEAPSSTTETEMIQVPNTEDDFEFQLNNYQREINRIWRLVEGLPEGYLDLEVGETKAEETAEDNHTTTKSNQIKSNQSFATIVDHNISNGNIPNRPNSEQLAHEELHKPVPEQQLVPGGQKSIPMCKCSPFRVKRVSSSRKQAVYVALESLYSGIRTLQLRQAPPPPPGYFDEVLRLILSMPSRR